MAKQRKPPLRTTKKHLARAERERIQRRWVLTITIVMGLIVIGILIYGWINTQLIQPAEPIAFVNGEEITTREFQNRVRVYQWNLISQGENIAGMMQLFASNPELQQSFTQQLAEIQYQLQNPLAIGQTAFEQLTTEMLIQNEAERRGISVSQDEIDGAIYEFFGYVPEGTPALLPSTIPAPTDTPDPTAFVEIATVPTPTTGPSPTPSPTLEPLPTPTPFTEEAFWERYQTYLGGKSEFNRLEPAFRSWMEGRLYREKLLTSFEEETPREQEQALLRHILLEEQEVAREILNRLDEGETWESLVVEASIDSKTKDTYGDLGWYTQDRLLSRFNQLALPALSIPIGEVIGPMETSEGWHLIQVVDREHRPLSDLNYQVAVEDIFYAWLNAELESAEIISIEGWIDRSPKPPSLIR